MLSCCIQQIHSDLNLHIHCKEVETVSKHSFFWWCKWGQLLEALLTNAFIFGLMTNCCIKYLDIMNYGLVNQLLPRISFFAALIFINSAQFTDLLFFKNGSENKHPVVLWATADYSKIKFWRLSLLKDFLYKLCISLNKSLFLVKSFFHKLVKETWRICFWGFGEWIFQIIVSMTIFVITTHSTQNSSNY